MIHRSQIKFHETFQPEAGYLAKNLELASNNYSGSKFEISEKQGFQPESKKEKSNRISSMRRLWDSFLMRVKKGNIRYP